MAEPLSEDHGEIALVPDAVREAWDRHHESIEAWRDFLAGDEGRAWLRKRGEAHRRERERARDYRTPPDPFLLRAADRLYDECARSIKSGRIDARSPIGDATLDYREMRWPDGDPAAIVEEQG